MINTVNPLPAWQPYADRILSRLIAHYASILEADAEEDGADEDDKDRGRCPVPAIIAALDRAVSDACDTRDAAATHTAAAPAPIRIPARRLSMALRLAATLGDEAVLTAALDARRVVLLDGLLPEELGEVSWLLQHAILLQARDFRPPPRQDHTANTCLLLAPKVSEGEVSKHAAQLFQRDLSDALETEAPLLILLPAGMRMPETIRSAALPLRLRPLDRDILLRHLAQSHGLTGEADRESVRAALPGDHALAALSPTALALAAREPDALAVARRLASLTAPADSGPRLEEMTGASPALVAARRLVADLALWQRGEIAWSELSRSLLLYGPPGTGKSWLARAMGGSAGIACVAATFAEWQSAGHLGDMLREMRKSFAEARRLAPAILFIDEIDAVGSRNDDDSHGRNYRTQVINGFLAELDSIAREPGVIVVGACNHPERIDPAVIRPGRFDIRVLVPLPDAETIRGILVRHLRGTFDTAGLQSLATDCVGRSAAEIDAALRAARAEARQEGADLTLEHLRHHLGTDADPRSATVECRIAIHECGHAITCAALRLGTISRLVITTAGGEAHRTRAPSEARLTDIEDELSYILAGRAAERLMLGAVSAGAGGASNSDLAQATSLALAIDTTLGLGESGPVWHDTPAQAMLVTPTLADAVRQRLQEAEQRAEDILGANRRLLHEMAEELVTCRELQGDRLDTWLRKARPRAASRPSTDAGAIRPPVADAQEPITDDAPPASSMS